MATSADACHGPGEDRLPVGDMLGRMLLSFLAAAVGALFVNWLSLVYFLGA